MNNPNVKKPTHTVGILIFHRTPELVEMAQNCLASVVNSCKRDEVEIIVVDNGSTVRSDYWEKHADKYIRLNKNMGISFGWNQILKTARGKYICILGDDTKVHTGWLEAMEECFENKDCGWANPHVEHLPHGMGIVENYKWPSGACFMLSQEVVKKVGYFDEDTYFPCNYEDLDYETRVYKAGLKIYTNFHLTIQHLEGQTLHSPDLASKNEVVRQAYLKKWGFDPIPVFFKDAILPIAKINSILL